ncbi:hypothetical protein JXB41_00545 [Candidatus Woesearchaeota archaeon]|nr:hypothetical protein [Candidatus Woesearchaeota archaeon]
MAYAIDIINDCFKKTKQLLFPIKKEYWLKMALVSLFSSNNYSPGNNISQNINSSDFPKGSINIREWIAKLNSNALDFLVNYGLAVGLVFSFFLFFGLILSYLNAVFNFIFIDGVVNKTIKIRKSFSKNKALGASLFFFRIIFSLINFAVFIAIFSPIILAFFSNRLAEFNYWLLIPMVFVFFIIVFIIGIIYFIVNEFLILIMFFNNKSVKYAWVYFKKIAFKKKLQIVLYWFMKIVLGVGAAIISVFLVFFLLILFAIVVLLLLGIGYLIYILIKALLVPLIIIGVILAIILFFAFIYTSSLVTLPIRVFFQYYAILMLEKLEKGK